MNSNDTIRRRAIIDKIRKCLALGRSPNENEAAAALAKAQVLMLEHSLSLDDVDFDDATARGNGCRQSPPEWEATLIDAVRRAIPCEVFLDAGKWRFVGRGPSAELAAYAFLVLHRQLKRARAQYLATVLRRVRPGRKSARADHFCLGWANVVHAKIRALAPPAATDEGLAQHVRQRFNLVTLEARDAGKVREGVAFGDYLNGAASGREADLHRPMGASAEVARIGA